MRKFLVSILRFPFKVILIPDVIFYSSILMYKHRDLFNDEYSRGHAFELILQIAILRIEVMIIKIDIFLCFITLGLYGFLLPSKTNQN